MAATPGPLPKVTPQQVDKCHTTRLPPKTSSTMIDLASLSPYALQAYWDAKAEEKKRLAGMPPPTLSKLASNYKAPPVAKAKGVGTRARAREWHHQQQR